MICWLSDASITYIHIYPLQFPTVIGLLSTGLVCFFTIFYLSIFSLPLHQSTLLPFSHSSNPSIAGSTHRSSPSTSLMVILAIYPHSSLNMPKPSKSILFYKWSLLNFLSDYFISSSISPTTL